MKNCILCFIDTAFHQRLEMPGPQTSSNHDEIAPNTEHGSKDKSFLMVYDTPISIYAVTRRKVKIGDVSTK